MKPKCWNCKWAVCMECCNPNRKMKTITPLSRSCKLFEPEHTIGEP